MSSASDFMGTGFYDDPEQEHDFSFSAMDTIDYSIGQQWPSHSAPIQQELQGYIGHESFPYDPQTNMWPPNQLSEETTNWNDQVFYGSDDLSTET